MIMYGVYNSDTLKDLIDTVHRMQNFTTQHEKTFAGKLHDWMEIYSQDEGVYNLCHKLCTISDYDTRKICENL